MPLSRLNFEYKETLSKEIYDHEVERIFMSNLMSRSKEEISFKKNFLLSLRVDRNIDGVCSELCSANILVIDDDRLNLMALEGILSYNFHLKTISCDRG